MSAAPDPESSETPVDILQRYLKDIEHLAHPFGTGGFGAAAERFARFFGTPIFLVGQTVVVVGWIVLNSIGVFKFDLYPFILLNLAFSTQAAYAAPLILLAQTRQADRDKAQADADARHREQVAQNALREQEEADRGIALIKKLIEENTDLTRRIDELTQQIHGKVVAG